MIETTFILGNGFDLDLGLKTRYSDFANSEYWTVVTEMKCHSGLSKYLEDTKSNNSNWLDLENSLAKYAAPQLNQEQAAKLTLFHAYGQDQECFLKVQEALGQYIASQERTAINKDSLAASLLKLMSQYHIENVFSYNYTDLKSFVQSLNLRPFQYHHVHGKCDNATQILGISDREKIRLDYDFLYKTCSSHYRSSNVRYALQRSTFVLFFGHSLGPQDYHYFENFFREQSRIDIKEKDKKTIYIITSDDYSRMQIIKQLRTMNEGYINLLFDCNEFRIFESRNTPPNEILAAINAKLTAINESKNARMIS